MVKKDTLHFDKFECAFSTKQPSPFAVYQNWIESIYVLNNVVAYSSLWSGAVYDELEAILYDNYSAAHFIGDIFQLIRKEVNTTFDNQSDYINMLNSMGMNGKPRSDFFNPSAVSVIGPQLLAYVHPVHNTFRYSFFDTYCKNIDKFKRFDMLLPGGRPENIIKLASAYAYAMPKKNVYTLVFPAVNIDNCFILITHEEIKTFKSYHVEKILPPKHPTYTLEQLDEVYSRL